MCTLQELFYTAPLLEKVLVTTLSLKDLTTLTTTSHWKWLACLGIRKTRRYYRFWCKNPLPEHFQVTKDSTGSALLRISWGTKYLRADFHVFPIRPYTASQKCALQTLACQSFVLTNTFLFLLAQAGYLQLPFLCIGQRMENLTLWKTSPSD